MERKWGKRKDYSFKLHGVKRTLDADVGLGSFNLEMPYDPKTSRFQKETYPSLLLDIKDKDQIEALEVMKRVCHPNILEIQFINEVEGENVRVYSERYSGVLSTYLKDLSLVNTKTRLIPSLIFRGLVSGAVDGLRYMRDNDEYHGNFALDTTFYFKDASKTTTKLANLERRRSKSLVECHVADCLSLGFSLHELSQYVKRQKGVPDIACCLLDDLVDWLTSVTIDTLDIVLDGIKDRVFFWDEKRRKTFFATEVVPEAWDRPAFQASFTNSQSMPAMPWTNKLYDGYLDAMKAYRDVKGIQDFESEDWRDFLRCITGMYTHHNELLIEQYVKSVDASVHCAHPRLCLDLKAAIDQPDEPPAGQA